MAKIAVVGAGFGGLSAASYLAKSGHEVTVYEKNDKPGGRANVIAEEGFVFDAGPSWYMMPDVFEDFFTDFGFSPSDFYELTALDPHYKVVTNDKSYSLPKYPEVLKTVKEIDPTAVDSFEKFYHRAEADYKTVRQHILEMPMVSSKEALDKHVLSFLLGRDMYRSYKSKIEDITDNEDLQHILQFMSVFMGGSPAEIPAIYSLLGYVDYGLGVYYPQGGFGQVAKAFESVAKNQGVTINYNSPVEEIRTGSGKINSLVVNGKEIGYDLVVANADYHHVDQELVPRNDSTYSKKKWENIDLSPSALLIFLGIDRRLKNLAHHTLFFDTDWDAHFMDIKSGQWSKSPLFYMSAPSLTDDSVAPKGHENLFVLAPMPAGEQASQVVINETVANILSRISEQVGVDINSHIVYQKILAQDYFKNTFNALGGNAFGPSHTLRQSAIFRPKMKSNKLSNLYYSGQYTNPGTGVPMVALSGKAVSKLIESNV